MSNIDKFLQSQQGMAQAHSNLQSQFNQNYNIQKQIYAAKQQALGSAKALVGQQIGQERLETILGTAPLAKKVGSNIVRAAQNPERAAAEVKEGLSNVGQKIRTRAESAAKSVADRFRKPLDDAQSKFTKVKGDIEDAAERVTEPLRTAPGDIEYSAERGFSTPFGRAGGRTISGGVRPPAEPKEAAARDTFEFKPPTRSEQLSKVAEENRVERLKNIDPSEVRAPENVQSQIKDLSGHTLNPTETREVDPLQNVSADDIGLQLPKVEGIAESALKGAIPVSQARSVRFGESDFPPPPRELREVPRQADPTGSYQRPGTDYKVQSNRSNPDEAAEPEANPIKAQAEQTEAPAEPEPTSAEDLSDRMADIKSGIQRQTGEALREQPSSSDDVIERFRQAAQQRIRDAPEPGSRTTPQDFPDVPQTSGGEEQRSEGGIDKGLEDRLNNLKGDTSGESTLAEGGDAERTADFVGREVASTAAKTTAETGAELGAEAPLLEVPGLGEVAMAATLIGSLIHGEKEAKQETSQTPGPAPAPEKAPTPYINFDAAPTLDTSSYHQN